VEGKKGQACDAKKKQFRGRVHGRQRGGLLYLVGKRSARGREEKKKVDREKGNK